MTAKSHKMWNTSNGKFLCEKKGGKWEGGGGATEEPTATQFIERQHDFEGTDIERCVSTSQSDIPGLRVAEV